MLICRQGGGPMYKYAVPSYQKTVLHVPYLVKMSKYWSLRKGNHTVIGG